MHMEASYSDKYRYQKLLIESWLSKNLRILTHGFHEAQNRFETVCLQFQEHGNGYPS